jgi:hypothetical protein
MTDAAWVGAVSPNQGPRSGLWWHVLSVLSKCQVAIVCAMGAGLAAMIYCGSFGGPKAGVLIGAYWMLAVVYAMLALAPLYVAAGLLHYRAFIVEVQARYPGCSLAQARARHGELAPLWWRSQLR